MRFGRRFAANMRKEGEELLRWGDETARKNKRPAVVAQALLLSEWCPGRN